MPENTEDSRVFRNDLRKTLLALRLALPAAEHARHSRRISRCLEDWLLTRATSPDTPPALGFCLPYKGEPNLQPLLERLAAQAWRLCVPVVERAGAPMVFRHWQPGIPQCHDRHDVPIPDSALVPPPGLLLLPVVGVDAQGYRLGYGGGYFDRTLAALAAGGVRPLCVGIGFALARVASIRPQAHDQPLDLMVTEAGLQHFSERNGGLEA